MRVVIIRHHDMDSAGFVSEAFEALGADVSTYLFPDGGGLPGLDDVDHVVVLGAVPSVNDDHAWIAEELAWLRAADEASVPILGICFGGQMLCVLAGGTVEQSPRKEIGWVMVDALAPEPVPAGPWLEFHGDRCLLPGHVQLLASNELCAQAFSFGRHLGVQFHPEVDGEQLKRWFDGGGRSEALAHGTDPDELLAQTIREEPHARARAATLVAAAIQLAAAPAEP